MTSAAAITTHTHLGRNIPRVSFLQRHALYIQNHPVSSKVLQVKHGSYKIRLLEGLNHAVFSFFHFGVGWSFTISPGCPWVALRGDSGGMLVGVTHGPPTSVSLFTRDPKGNTTVININPTSLCPNKTNTISRSPAGVQNLSSAAHNLAQGLVLCLSRLEQVHEIILLTRVAAIWHFLSFSLLFQSTLRSQMSQEERITGGEAFILPHHQDLRGNRNLLFCVIAETC